MRVQVPPRPCYSAYLVSLLCTKMEIEDILLGVFEKAGSVDWMAVLKIVGISAGVFWLFVVLWVWLDARERVNSIIVRILYTLLVLCFNIIGLIIYLLIRPGQTKEECYYAELERKYLLYQTSGLEDCPKCGTLLYPEYIFCPCCGEEIQTKCTKCSTMVNKKLNYCPSCGEELIKKDDFDVSTAVKRDFRFWRGLKKNSTEKTVTVEKNVKKTPKVKKERKPLFSFFKPVFAFIVGIFKAIASVIVGVITFIGRFIISIFRGIAGLFSRLFQKISRSREERKLKKNTDTTKKSTTKSTSKSSKKKNKQKKNRRKK